ncbi:hypothetical protein [Polyangium spumosum]|uniref:Uncharacterized protein n=1 Tax=Polyangium spumosum TaxID=889282 RepID=A0A6N7PG05_9BACT|nr:hypothetical protein [Polyangium spumosum]MRG90993.1 hypothetical protein [Polyangium spumosum]
MEMPGEDTSPKAYPPKSAYSISRAAADPKTAGLEKDLEAAHVDLKKALREQEDLEEQVQRKSAILDVCDEYLDDDIGGFQLGLLTIVDKNREAPKYLRYFPKGLREVTTAEPRKEEPEIVEQMLEAMVEDQADPELGPLVTTWMPKLSASRAKVLAASEDLTISEKQLAFLNEKTLPALMAAWRTAYKTLEGKLTAVYASNPKKVDRFFKPFRKPRKSKKTDT